MCIARYTLAVDRRFKREGDQSADFISCIVFGKSAEHAEKYYHKGIKVVICGRIQTGSYTNRDGQKVYTTDVVVEEQEFAESKSSSSSGNQSAGYQGGGFPNTGHQHGYGQPDADGFMNIPDGIDEELPLN